MKYENFTFFYTRKHPFSNLHPAKFKATDGLYYSCLEQYIMAEKARLFGDQRIRNAILSSEDPYEHKRLGRKVKGFDQEIWERTRIDIVYRGAYLKFTQNPKMLLKLIETKGTLLAEASPTDLVWGVGLSEDDPRILDQKNWTGKNLLGETLTRLRDYLIEPTVFEI